MPGDSMGDQSLDRTHHYGRARTSSSAKFALHGEGENRCLPSFLLRGFSRLTTGRRKHIVDTDKLSSSTSSSDEFVSQMLPENAKELLFTLEELKKATSNFSPACEIGQGGYGVVYKGRLTDGREVAIKREIQEKESSNERSSFDFSCELSLLAGVEHFNLVKLLGYCDGNNERILVQEYVCNGTLRHHLDCERGVVLDFPKRLDIAIDVAHALTYLHFHAERPIIHRDIKSTNVLLTRNFRAKLADFGFAQGGVYNKGDMHISKQVKGTAGYLDPEYLKSLQLSSKSDVYSFGILLVEILTGRHPIEPHRPTDQRTTILWAYKNYLKGNLTDILDLKLEKSKAMELVARKVFNLAFQCSAPIMDERPDMKQVGNICGHLEGNIKLCRTRRFQHLYLKMALKHNRSSLQR